MFFIDTFVVNNQHVSLNLPAHFLLLCLLLRFLFTLENTGINPLTFDQEDNAHNYNGKVFKFITGFEFILIVIYAYWENGYNYLLPFWYLEFAALKTTGWVFLVFALIWVFTAQLQMGNSWRIGIDQHHSTDLIQHGLFSVSRNPIFLGLLLANLGLFLVLPNAFTLSIFSLTFYSIQIQVRLEEDFLQATKGDSYIRYQQKVRRWI